jgi:hypothetical protein
MAQNLSQANAKAIDALGVAKSDFTTELSVVESVCGAFIQRVKENINSIPNFVNSGKIENLTLESAGDEVHIKGSQHLLYQYRGVNGAKEKLYETPYSYGDKKPPMQVFLTWIQEKNIRMVDNPKYYGKASPFKEVTEDKKQEQLAWMMVNSVFNKGIKPHPAIKWDEEKEQLKKDLIAKAKGFVIQKLKTEIYNKYGDRVDQKG